VQGQAISSLLWFAAVIAAIPLALWLFKRSPLGAGMAGQGAAPMKVVGALALSPSQRIVTVEVGEGAARTRLVLGVTAQQITTLHQLPAGADPS
jgi:flagellar protein FliO/FliZ